MIIRKIQFLTLLIIAFNVVSAQAQQRYYIIFKDKDTADYQPERYLSPDCIEKRKTQGLPLFQASDIPVNAAYVEYLQSLGVVPQTRLRWFNAVGARLTQAQHSAVSQLPFVASIQPIGGYFYATGEVPEVDLGTAAAQVNGGVFRKQHLNGKGLIIGLIDAGFLGAKEQNLDKHLFESGKVKGWRDFVEPTHTKNFFGSSEDESVDSHGTTVLSFIAGKSDQKQTGLAPEGKFFLARTDNSKKEFRAEEDYWLAALEFMDSSGVRLINTSLGYANGFDKPQENHKLTDIDGKTSKVTQAAILATTKKGIFLVVSAGNEGSDPEWGIISAPADCATALTVGATYAKAFYPVTRADYSSYGPASLPYVKPDVVCHSMNGTSFSAPVMTGFMACLIQKYPKLKNDQLLSVVKYSSSLANSPNNVLGYGLPNAEKALELAAKLSKGEDIKPTAPKVVNAPDESFLLNFPDGVIPSCTSYVQFDKDKDNRTVVNESVNEMKLINDKLLLKKQPGAKYTTIQLCDGYVVEIKWPDAQSY